MVLYGTVGATEIFETGFWVVGTTPSSDLDVQTMAGKVAAAWEANSTQQKSIISNDTAYTEVRGYFYGDTSGKATHTGSAPITGGGGTSAGFNCPLQTCMVMTLRTGYAGRSNRGRMYLPANGINLGTDHLYGSAALQSLVIEFAAFLSDVITDGSIGAPVVVSRTESAYQTITAVDADYRPDIQRRRANKQGIGGRFGVPVPS